MSTFIEGDNGGDMNGTTEVVVVAAPAGTGTDLRRIVKNAKFCNIDTVACTVRLFKKVSGTSKEIARETLQPGETWVFDDSIVLGATTKSVVANLLASHTTTAPTFETAFAMTS